MDDTARIEASGELAKNLCHWMSPPSSRVLCHPLRADLSSFEHGPKLNMVRSFMRVRGVCVIKILASGGWKVTHAHDVLTRVAVAPLFFDIRIKV